MYDAIKSNCTNAWRGLEIMKGQSNISEYVQLFIHKAN